MRRILFVDDDQNVLDGFRDSLRGQRRQWQMVFALGGAVALDQIAEGGPFDVVISDMRMPDMDGAELLRRVKTINPSAARIVLSGQAEEELLLRALPVAHQYLSKPLRVDALRAVIERACLLREQLPLTALQELAGSIDCLPSLERHHEALLGVLAEPGAGLPEVAAIAKIDTALEAKLLQFANSEIFGRSQRVSSASSAVSCLGIKLLRSMALVEGIFRAPRPELELPGFSLEDAQREALRGAALARQLVDDPKDQEDAYSAGLLCNVGQLVFAVGARERYAHALCLSAESGRPLHLVEREVLGASHAEVGAFLLGTWGLPDVIVQAVAHHHEPPISEGTAVLRAVKLASSPEDA